MEICALLTHARVCQPWVKISGGRAPEIAAHFPAGPFDPVGCVKRAAYPAASWAKCEAPTESLIVRAPVGPPDRGWDESVRLWDPATGAPVGDPATGTSVHVVSLGQAVTSLASIGSWLCVSTEQSVLMLDLNAVVPTDPEYAR